MVVLLIACIPEKSTTGIYKVMPHQPISVMCRTDTEIPIMEYLELLDLVVERTHYVIEGSTLSTLKTSLEIYTIIHYIT